MDGEMAGWTARIRAGDRRALARAITAVENETIEGRTLLAALSARDGAPPDSRPGSNPRQAVGERVIRTIGITGPPGAGKSTLVNALIRELLERGKTIAVIAVDPSSPITGGAVLGDRIRMGDVHADPRVFIRSLAARGHLGGLTKTARDVLGVVVAAGFDVVLIETVGTGQSEVEIARIAQTTVVVCPPGLGDDVQAMKAGVLEIADVLVVNKADLPDADRTERELRAMLALRRADRRPPVLKTSATTGDGVAALAQTLLEAAGRD
jgi:LAO/AO transport system ATPase